MMFGDARLPSRFWSKVRVNDGTGCWEWTAAKFTDGYAKFSVHQKNRRGHRVAYEAMVAPIPDGLQIDHVRARGCMVRHCVNPAHLEVVSCRENLMRAETLQAVNAAKTHCNRGHRFDAENTRTRRNGSRSCRTCQRERMQRRRRALRARSSETPFTDVSYGLASVTVTVTRGSGDNSPTE